MHSEEAQPQHPHMRLIAAAELRANQTLQGLIHPDYATQLLDGAHQNSAPCREALGNRPESALPDAMADWLERTVAKGAS